MDKNLSLETKQNIKRKRTHTKNKHYYINKLLRILQKKNIYLHYNYLHDKITFIPND